MTKPSMSFAGNFTDDPDRVVVYPQRLDPPDGSPARIADPGVAANPQPTHSWDRHGDRVPNAVSPLEDTSDGQGGSDED